MASNIGSQTVTLLFHTIANSLEWNKRFIDIRKIGIYTGGWLSIINNTTAQISSLICEISDGNYQVKIKTATTVNITVSSTTPYIVLRWTYTGSVTNDFMSLLAVVTPATNDVVVGKCTFDGSLHLNGFNYGDTTYSRTDPAIQDLFLKVEATGDSDLRVRIRSGRIQTASANISIADQKSDLITRPVSYSKVYLVYVNTDTGIISIDSSGTAAITPVAPNYGGKLVLAEITLASTDTSISQSKIKDVRSFINIGRDYIARRDYIQIRDTKSSQTPGGTFTHGAWRIRDLTEIASDDGGHATLLSNQITLAAGTYECAIMCPARWVNHHRARLFNISDNAVVEYGDNAHSTGADITYSTIIKKFTITTPKVLRIEHFCDQSRGVDGFGCAGSNPGDGAPEIFTTAEFWKVA